MKEAARVAAAIEILADIQARHRPVSAALADWGKAHRFAGSGDRSAIGTIVYDAVRRRASSAHAFGSDTPRAHVLGALRDAWNLTPESISQLFSGEGFAPSALSSDEHARLSAPLDQNAPSHVRGNYPEWLDASLARAFGDRRAEAGAALSARAPLDVRANLLKADRDKVLKALAKHDVEPTPFAPHGIRIPAPVGAARAPNVEAETAHGKGWFEVQDEGSQIAAALAGAGPRQQVLDLCAGAGGKSLALAGAMHNTGQIYAYDSDKSQLRPIFERLKRAGARNVQVIDAGDTVALNALGDRFDLVLIDAPCTGSGVWRRHPDSKWRLKPHNLEQRLAEQAAVLATGARFVKPGGRLVYVTCSILPEENIDRVEAFLNDTPSFRLVPFAQAWQSAIGTPPPASADNRADTLLLAPHTHQTDGFFVAVMTRQP